MSIGLLKSLGGFHLESLLARNFAPSLRNGLFVSLGGLRHCVGGDAIFDSMGLKTRSFGPARLSQSAQSPQTSPRGNRNFFRDLGGLGVLCNLESESNSTRI